MFKIPLFKNYMYNDTICDIIMQASLDMYIPNCKNRDPCTNTRAPEGLKDKHAHI